MLFVISAPSGIGKTTLVKKLLQNTERLRLSVSHTTRKPRIGEKDGIDYHFVSPSVFQDLKGGGEFVETAIVHGESYGTARSQIEENERNGISTLLDIDTQGAMSIQAIYPEAILIFIMPPSEPELKKRLERRATEDREELERRFRSARAEIAMKDRYDYVIINDDLEKAVHTLKGIIEKERNASS